jgi:hypothetical protein
LTIQEPPARKFQEPGRRRIPSPAPAKVLQEPAPSPAPLTPGEPALPEVSRPSRRGFVLLTAAAVALLAGGGWVVRDHLVTETLPAGSLHNAFRMAESYDPPASGLAALLDPGDSRYVSLSLGEEAMWFGNGLILEGHYLRFPERAEPVQRFLAGAGGPVRLTLDLAGSSPSFFKVEAVTGPEAVLAEEDLLVEVHPLASGPNPEISSTGGANTYRDASGVRYDQRSSFEGTRRFAVSAHVERVPRGLRLTTEGFKLALDGEMSFPVRQLLEDLALTEEEMSAGKKTETEGGLAQRKVVAFVEVLEIFGWAEDGVPLRRQLTREIGRAAVDGIRLGPTYIPNRTGS